MKSLRFVFPVWAVSVAVCGLLPADVVVAQEVEEEPLEHPALASLGGLSGDEDDLFSGSFVLPYWATEEDVFFFNPNTTQSGDEDYVNLGGGYRHWLPSWETILGANIFYDHLKTEEGSNFERFGFGFELLSPWGDARINLYLSGDSDELLDTYPVDTVLTEGTRTSSGSPYGRRNEIVQDTTQQTVTRTLHQKYGRYEQPLEGFDFEVGGWAPFVEKWLMEAGAFAGYYRYGENFGDGDADGYKTRLEVRGLPGMVLDAQAFADTEFDEIDYYIGGRVEIPLDLAALFGGRNPFAHAFRRGPRPFGWRLAEGVVRMPRVVVKEEVKEIPLPAGQRITETVNRVRRTQVLLSDVQFVDNRNTTGMEDGTIKRPFDTVQEAVDGARGARNVYVFAGRDPYPENVVMREGVTMIGQGFPIRGPNGGVLGGDAYPTIDGRSRGPALTLADRTTVRGMRFINTDLGGPPRFVTIGEEVFDISRVGVFGRDVKGVTLGGGNIIEGNSYGVLLGADRTESFFAAVQGNTIRGNSADGLRVSARGMSGTFTFLSVNNTYTANEGDGLHVSARDFDVAAIGLLGDRATGNRGDGIDLSGSSGNDRLVVLLAGVAADDNGAGGEYFFEESGAGVNLGYLDVGAGGFSGFFTGVSASGNGDAGIRMDIFSQGPIEAQFNDVTLDDNRWGGLNALLVSESDVDLTLSGVRAHDGWDEGADGIGIGAVAGASLSLAMSDVAVDGNEGSGIQANLSAGRDVDVSMRDVTASGNGWTGVWLEAFASNNITASFRNMQANGNGGDGMRVELIGQSGAASVSFRDVEASGNGLNGVQIGATSFGQPSDPEPPEYGPGLPGYVSVFGQGLTARNNEVHGVNVMEMTGGFWTEIDFGGGVLGSLGGNSISGNGQVGLHSETGIQFPAWYTFWGNVPPLPGVDHSPGVDASNFLATDPNP